MNRNRESDPQKWTPAHLLASKACLMPRNKLSCSRLRRCRFETGVPASLELHSDAAQGAVVDIVLCACSLRMYNSVVERCFKDCVESFRRKDLEASEEKVCQSWPGPNKHYVPS